MSKDQSEREPTVESLEALNCSIDEINGFYRQSKFYDIPYFVNQNHPWIVCTHEKLNNKDKKDCLCWVIKSIQAWKPLNFSFFENSDILMYCDISQAIPDSKICKSPIIPSKKNKSRRTNQFHWNSNIPNVTFPVFKAECFFFFCFFFQFLCAFLFFKNLRICANKANCCMPNFCLICCFL